jgi:hypothetical protein
VNFRWNKNPVGFLIPLYLVRQDIRASKKKTSGRICRDILESSDFYE